MQLAQLATGESFVRKYRGYDIVKIGTKFAVKDGFIVVANANTAWSCMAWIDERLSP